MHLLGEAVCYEPASEGQIPYVAVVSLLTGAVVCCHGDVILLCYRRAPNPETTPCGHPVEASPEYSSRLKALLPWQSA